MATVNSLYTTIQNLQDSEVTLGFLGASGVNLAGYAELVVKGDLVSRLASDRNRAKFRTLENMLSSHKIAILRGPLQPHWDETLNDVKLLTVDNGAAVLANPDWGNYQAGPPPSVS